MKRVGTVSYTHLDVYKRQTKESKDEDKDSGSEAYPDEVLKVLRGLKDGEVADNIIETDTGYYVVRLDKINDEDATASKRESLQN